MVSLLSETARELRSEPKEVPASTRTPAHAENGTVL